jgi:hypothetical protein
MTPALGCAALDSMPAVAAPGPHTYTPHDTSTISKWSLTILERKKVNKSNKHVKGTVSKHQFIMMVGTLASFFLCTSDKKKLKLDEKRNGKLAHEAS